MRCSRAGDRVAHLGVAMCLWRRVRVGLMRNRGGRRSRRERSCACINRCLRMLRVRCTAIRMPTSTPASSTATSSWYSEGNVLCRSVCRHRSCTRSSSSSSLLLSGMLCSGVRVRGMCSHRRRVRGGIATSMCTSSASASSSATSLSSAAALAIRLSTTTSTTTTWMMMLSTAARHCCSTRLGSDATATSASPTTTAMYAISKYGIFFFKTINV